MGGVAHKPWKLVKAEAYLKGKKPNQVNFEVAAEMEMKEAKPLQENKYKIEMGRNATVRALTQAYEKNT